MTGVNHSPCLRFKSFSIYLTGFGWAVRKLGMHLMTLFFRFDLVNFICLWHSDIDFFANCTIILKTMETKNDEKYVVYFCGYNNLRFY